MYTKQEIILRSYREGKSQRQISRELQINRKTVKKYVEECESLQRVSKPTECCKILTSHLLHPPECNLGNRGKRRLTEEVLAAVEVHIAANRQKLENGQRKQVLKKIDIYESLQQQGFDVGYTTICNYIRSKAGKRTVKEAFIRQVYQPGSVCEFDWAEIKIEINGAMGRYYIAVFTSAYSNYRYALIFQRQDTLAFMESHVSFFSHIGGVYHQMTYDNMRVAVARFIGPHEKEPTRALLEMRGHYMFTHRFCNVYSGNEKGHVERSVEYIRRKAFGPGHVFSTLEQAAEHLFKVVDSLNQTKQQLTGKSAVEMFEQERSFLYQAPSPLACSESTPLHVDKYATVSYGTNHYSVPDNLVESCVDVKIYGQKLEIFSDNRLLATHIRNFGRHQWIISIEHYLTTFSRKPGALASSVALVSSPYLKTLYDKYFTDTPRDFIDLLQFCIRFNIEQSRLEDTVNGLVRLCAHRITSEKIMAILGNKTSETSLPVSDNNEITVQSKNLLKQITAILN
jgi:transposase/transposase-like protein